MREFLRAILIFVILYCSYSFGSGVCKDTFKAYRATFTSSPYLKRDVEWQLILHSNNNSKVLANSKSNKSESKFENENFKRDFESKFQNEIINWKQLQNHKLISFELEKNATEIEAGTIDNFLIVRMRLNEFIKYHVSAIDLKSKNLSFNQSYNFFPYLQFKNKTVNVYNVSEIAKVLNWNTAVQDVVQHNFPQFDISINDHTYEPVFYKNTQKLYESSSHMIDVNYMSFYIDNKSFKSQLSIIRNEKAEIIDTLNHKAWFTYDGNYIVELKNRNELTATSYLNKVKIHQVVNGKLVKKVYVIEEFHLPKETGEISYFYSELADSLFVISNLNRVIYVAKEGESSEIIAKQVKSIAGILNDRIIYTNESNELIELNLLTMSSTIIADAIIDAKLVRDQYLVVSTEKQIDIYEIPRDSHE